MFIRKFIPFLLATIFMDVYGIQSKSRSLLKNVWLTAAYKVQISGSSDWALLRNITKEPIFVEGFEMIDDNNLIQSAGLYAGSEIQLLSIDFKQNTSKITNGTSLGGQIFGEGCTKVKDSIYQLTYRERKMFKYNLSDLKLNSTLYMQQGTNEGWGLCYDGQYLYQTDGTDKVFKTDPDTA